MVCLRACDSYRQILLGLIPCPWHWEFLSQTPFCRHSFAQMPPGGIGDGGMWRLSVSLVFNPRRSIQHINRLESEAVFHSLQAFLSTPSGKAVRFFTKKMTGRACSFPLSLRAEELLQWCHSHGIALSSKHIFG